MNGTVRIEGRVVRKTEALRVIVLETKLLNTATDEVLVEGEGLVRILE
jgi:hypothetical protein